MNAMPFRSHLIATAALTLLAAFSTHARAGGPAGDCEPHWDNSIGQPGMSGTGFTQVLALTEYDGDLIVGGNFNSAGGVSASHIARWNAATGNWQPIGDGFSNPVHALAVYNGELIAGGQFTASGATPISRIARWDESTSAWQPLGAGMNNGVFALTVYNDELIAAGNFTSAGGAPANGIARWNGSSWQQLGAGVNDLVEEVGLWSGDLIVGGKFTHAGGVLVNTIARWDGASWHALGGGMTGPPPGEFGPVPDVRSVIEYEGDLIAGGQYYSASNVPGTGSIARWDGTQWHALDQGVSAPSGPGTVTSMTIYDGDLIAAGSFITASGLTVNRIARWDGSAWHAMGEACPGDVAAGCGFNDNVSALTQHDGRVVAGGNFTIAFGLAASRIVEWEGCADAPAIPGDLNGDGSVGVADLLILLSMWGPCADCNDCPADLTGDCNVGVADLLILLANWG